MIFKSARLFTAVIAAGLMAPAVRADEDLMRVLLKVQKTLREHSEVNDWTADGETGQVLSTTLKIASKAEKITLVYERTFSTHEGDRSHFTQQNIEYSFGLEDLDSASVRVQEMGESYSKKDVWMVWATTKDEAGSISYSNLFEIQDSQGERQSSVSEGKVAIVTFGYFTDRGIAENVTAAVKNAIKIRNAL